MNSSCTGAARSSRPGRQCTCFFQPRCTNASFCLETLEVPAVAAAVERQLGAR